MPPPLLHKVSRVELNYWMDQNKTAVIPTITIDLGAAPMLNPAARMVTPEQRLSFISNADVTLVLEYYK